MIIFKMIDWYFIAICLFLFFMGDIWRAMFCLGQKDFYKIKKIKKEYAIIKNDNYSEPVEMFILKTEAKKRMKVLKELDR